MAGKNTMTLYTGPNCNLCEEAKDIIYPLLSSYALNLQIEDISQSEELKQKYGILIPVVQLPDGREKNWPFTQAQLGRMIEACL